MISLRALLKKNTKNTGMLLKRCQVVQIKNRSFSNDPNDCSNQRVFNEFCDRLFEHMDVVKKEEIPSSYAKVASYIPQLAKASPDTFAASICSVRGMVRSHGDDHERFSIQSCVKPFTYLLALEQHGQDKVHENIGLEPSGKGFNAFTFDEQNRPHNPMINTGAMVACSMLWPELEAMERFQKLTKVFDTFVEGSPSKSVHFDFDYATYKSERESGFKNYALAFLMNDNNAFYGDKPLKVDELVHSLNLYYQACSIELDIRGAAVLAGLLANGGVSPFDEANRLFEADHVVNTCQIMSSCGMYDYSGAWSCTVGLPSKSGVSGCILLVVPNLLGIAIISPPLDKKGNSYRGMQVCNWLASNYKLNMYRQLQSMDRESLARNIWSMNC